MTVDELVNCLKKLSKSGKGNLEVVIQTEKVVSQVDIHTKKDEKFVDLN